jgi:hypothetical protein
MIDDPEIQALAKAQRQKTLKRVGIVVAVVVVLAVSVFPSGSSVAASLEEDGYSDVEVDRAGLFSFTYKATKGGADCTGSVTKMPGSTSSSGMCINRAE